MPDLFGEDDDDDDQKSKKSAESGSAPAAGSGKASANPLAPAKVSGNVSGTASGGSLKMNAVGFNTPPGRSKGTNKDQNTTESAPDVPKPAENPEKARPFRIAFRFGNPNISLRRLFEAPETCQKTFLKGQGRWGASHTQMLLGAPIIPPSQASWH